MKWERTSDVENLYNMKITWLSGYPKSGTTWLRAFLSAYVHGTLDINNMIGYEKDDLNLVYWQTISSKPLPTVGIAESAALRGAALQAILIANEGKVTLKTHSSVADVMQYPMIPTAFTDRAIQVVRDPRDIAVSFAHYLGCTQAEAVHAMSQSTSQQKEPGLYWMLGDWSSHVMSWVDASFPVETIRYEDMLAKPAATFEGQVLEFLGIEFDYDRFMAGYRLTDFDALQTQECEHGFREMKHEGKFFRCGQAGAWKDKLDPELAKQIERQHGGAMRHFGYEVGVQDRYEELSEAAVG